MNRILYTLFCLQINLVSIFYIRGHKFTSSQLEKQKKIQNKFEYTVFVIGSTG